MNFVYLLLSKMEQTCEMYVMQLIMTMMFVIANDGDDDDDIDDIK